MHVAYSDKMCTGNL